MAGRYFQSKIQAVKMAFDVLYDLAPASLFSLTCYPLPLQVHFGHTQLLCFSIVLWHILFLLPLLFTQVRCTSPFVFNANSLHFREFFHVIPELSKVINPVTPLIAPHPTVPGLLLLCGPQQTTSSVKS